MEEQQIELESAEKASNYSIVISLLKNIVDEVKQQVERDLVVIPHILNNLLQSSCEVKNLVDNEESIL